MNMKMPDKLMKAGGGGHSKTRAFISAISVHVVDSTC
jgi:hypothetical protein